MVQTLNGRSNRGTADRLRKRSEARRLDILRAAARVFRRRGTAATGMREIAQEAELSPGNLYYYFESKDKLLHFCQERTLEQLLAAADEAKASAPSCSERLRAVLRAHVRALLDEMEGGTAHLEIESLPDALRLPLIKKRDTSVRYAPSSAKVLRVASSRRATPPSLRERCLARSIGLPAGTAPTARKASTRSPAPWRITS